MRLCCLLFIVLLTALAGCSRSPAKISITNKSGGTLENVQVSGENFSTTLGSMADGTSMNFALQERSQTNVWLTFTARGQSVDSRGSAKPIFFDVNARHPLSLTIETDLKVQRQ